MDAEAVLAWVDTLVLTQTGQRLSDLQRTILRKVWQGKKYIEIALQYGCTEGHVKDVGSDLWQLLSRQLGEKITKRNLRSALARYLTYPCTETTGSSLTTSSPELLSPVPAAEPAHFVGRAAAIHHLNALAQQNAKVIVVQGEGGLGKTTLAQYYLQTQEFELVLELLMAKETQTITAAERVVEEWLRHDFGQEPSIEFGINLGRLKRNLHQRRVGVLIDNLEPALNQQGQLIAQHRSYVELLRVLSDARVQSLTLITSRDRLCESHLNVVHYRLPGLEQQAWQQFFGSRGIRVESLILDSIHRAYGGNAKAMGLLCGVMQEDFASDMTAYWQAQGSELWVTTDLQDLVSSQVERLQVLDPQAYRLFCRLGCYRYQDVPGVATPGLLCLLWDVPSEQHRQIVASLRNRSLVEYHNGNYWLHPVMRAEAIARLRASNEWETVNRRAAEFWTSHVQTIQTTQDALQALEAYYHYVAIHDFEQAGRVILKSRHNQWQQFLPLGSTLYRMGRPQPVLAAIHQVLSHVQPHANLSELYNILGDLCWITGKVQDAIACQEKTIALATQELQALPLDPATRRQFYYLKMLEVDSLLSIGLYRIDLWELETAAQLFQQVIDQAQHTDHHRWAEKAIVCLALVQSYLDQQSASRTLSDISCQSLLDSLLEQTGRFTYFIQILGQAHLNLGNLDQANELLHRALTFAEAASYTQIKAKTLTGFAGLYRCQANFDRALVMHTQAIELLHEIGATCDLAEAYFQQGLTYQALHRHYDAQVSFARSIQLFTEMQAPRQVEKVLRQG